MTVRERMTGPLGPIRVLLIEDDPDDAVLTRELLQEIADDVAVDWSDDETEALQRMLRGDHDVVLLDHRLGSATGLELLRSATGSGHHKPVIVLTGQGDRRLDLESMEAGAFDYLAKGELSASLLERSIRYALNHHRTLEALRASERELQRAAFHDPLTGLPNRALLLERIEHHRALSRRRKELLGVLFLDLDGFKPINDSLGHAVGDEVLREVAERLKLTVRGGDTVARLGGDEFVVVAQGDARGLQRLAERILDALREPFSVDGHEDLRVTASVGIAFAESEDGSEDLIRKADMAMYRAKTRRNAFAIFAPVMHREVAARLELERDLRRALAAGAFELNYQPIVDLGSGAVTAFEALLRWRSPLRGPVSPGEFLPLAEESGLIVPIGAWVLREACRWTAALGPETRVGINVNLSARQLLDPALVDQIAKALETSGLAPERLNLEITETLLIRDPRRASAALERIKELGVRPHLDDFGTGYSSLSHVVEFPIDVIKIDRSFVQGMVDRFRSSEIVRTILTLGESLELDVIAEGIETEPQRAALLELGCDLGQGFLIARPLPGDRARALIDLPD